MKTLLLAITAALAVAGGAAQVQDPPKAHDHGEQTMPAPPAHGMPMHGMPMSMAAQDEKLDALVAEMNAARGNDRVDKIVAVLNALVAERKAMHDHMKGMMKGDAK